MHHAGIGLYRAPLTPTVIGKATTLQKQRSVCAGVGNIFSADPVGAEASIATLPRGAMATVQHVMVSAGDVVLGATPAGMRTGIVVA